MSSRKTTKKALDPAAVAAVDDVTTAENIPDARFPIIGIGASAGGLEASEQFFRNVPAASGLAFVLVQHLDPSHDSLLTEILQRCTSLPVVEAVDQVIVAPNHVYVIPPNRDLTIFHGTLQLSLPEMPRGQRMPIDAFLRSLAEDRGERAVGIVLSGTGTDGTQGLRAILGAGGITLVQDPATAKYDGMPESAIKAGFATHILAVEGMPAVLLARARNGAGTSDLPALASSPALSTGGVAKVLQVLRAATGNDFALYKKSTIGRRIERRMAQQDLTDIEIYARFLKEHPVELRALFKELLINVTSFFRDPEAFVALKQDILPQLAAGKPVDYVFRIWVPGCSTGEEAYSIAIVMREFMDETRQEFKVQLYSTDLDDDAIATARAGVYPPNIVADMSPERLRRFFVKEEAGYRIRKQVRDMVVFAIQNVIKDPPFTRLDLVSCRNLMIYLEPELQNRLIQALHYALKPGGVLLLSPAESVGNHTQLFAALNRKWKFYKALETSASASALIARGSAWSPPAESKEPRAERMAASELNLAALTRRVLLQAYAPPSLVTDATGTILYVHGETGKYLRPAPGNATLNVVDMAREGLQFELRAALRLAANEGLPTLGRELSLNTNGDNQTVSLSVRPLSDPGGNASLMLVSFGAAAEPAAAKGSAGSRRRTVSASARSIAELERDLAHTRQSLQATIEGQQAANEELQSTNEELQSTNEELQSTNEELETSKEELQSINEEMITVNTELQAKIEQLTGMQNDMKNLLDSTNIGTIFLDQQMLIRRFTREAAQIYRLVASDLGRRLADIKSDLEHDDLLGAAQTVLDSLVPFEREVRVGGVAYLARIQPYRTLDNVIQGVVLTFTDISKLVAAEAAERNARQLAESIIATVREPLVIMDGDLKVISASRSFYRRFQVAHKDVVGRPLYELGNGQWDIATLRELLESILPRDESFDDFVVEHDFPAIGHCKLVLNARRVVGANGAVPLILLAMEDAGRPS
jgi:two-component system, chemotaxis family, CheB/CheR fusion protein